MARVSSKLLLVIVLSLILSGCASSKIDFRDSLQSSSAAILKKDFDDLASLLVEFKSKLDLRNPKNFDINNHDKIVQNILKRGNNFTLSQTNNNQLELYHQYLNLAFDTKDTKWYKNDLLIVGIYKMFYDAYEIKRGHKMTALSYDINKLQKTYKYLQVIRWRINNLKDENNQPLFVTWQNNWQLELANKLKNKEAISWESVQNLHHIKAQKESLFDSSNMSFDNIFAQMLYIMKKDMKLIGVEPATLGLEGIKSVVLFL